MRRIPMAICVMFCAVLFSACAPELYERLLISAVGVDALEGGSCRVTVRAAPTTENGRELCVSGEGESVPAAMEQIALHTGKAPLYSHNTILIFGHECAEKGLASYLDFFIRHYESRPTVHTFLAEHTAEEILRPDAESGAEQETQIAELTERAGRTGLSVPATILSLVQGTRGEGFGAALPVVKRDGTVRLYATALLEDLKLRCTLSEEETRGLLFLDGTVKEGEIVLEDVSGRTTVNLQKVVPEIHFLGTAEDPIFSVTLSVAGEISAADCFENPMGSFARLETLLSERVLDYVGKYLEQAAFQNGTDAAGFGNAVFREAPRVWEEISGSWPEALKKAVFQIEVKSVIDRVEEEDFSLLH